MVQKGLFEIKDISSVGKMNGKYNHSWVEESFDLEETDRDVFGTKKTRSYLGEIIGEKRRRWLIITLLLGFSLIFGRILYLQIWQGYHYRDLAENNRARTRSIPAERGIIFDRQGKPLVENVPSFLLSIVPQDLPSAKNEPVKRKQVINQIADLSGVPKENIDDLLERYKDYSYESLTIKENLDYDTALNLYIKNANLPGLLIEKSTKRHYLIGDELNQIDSVLSLSHIIGYLGKLNDGELEEKKPQGYFLNDYIGKTGLEKNYETQLHGQNGKRRIEMDAGGHEQMVLSEETPQLGKNLYLSLDLEMQKKLEKIMRNYLLRNGNKRAAGIVMDPRDGSVLAMVSLPTFDANKFSNGINQVDFNVYNSNPDHPLFNRAISGVYPSGSTIKMIVSAAALEEKVITATTAFLSAGGLQVNKWFFRDWLVGGHGLTNVRKAIAWSVNTFFYYIGGGYANFVGLGVDRLTKYMRLFNLGQKTGIDLPGEGTGFVPSKEWKKQTKGEDWYVGDTYNLSIGQGDLLVTPLQVALWTSAVANGGILYQPHLANKFYDPNTKKEEMVKPRILNQNFISAYNMSIVKEGMGDCVRVGGCQAMKSLSFTTGGKTGTAQWSAKKDNQAWYTAFAPFGTPQIVVTVLVEEGREGYVASMPIVREFLAWWGSRYLK